MNSTGTPRERSQSAIANPVPHTLGPQTFQPNEPVLIQLLAQLYRSRRRRVKNDEHLVFT